MPTIAIPTYSTVVQASATPSPNALMQYDAQGGATANALTGTVGTVNSLAVGVATYTTTQTLDATILHARANAAGGVFTITLPPAATVTGRIYTIKKIDSSGNLVTVKGNGSELIDAANTNTSLSAQYNTLRLISNGAGWDVI